MAGRNRLQAARELGWEGIDAIELPHLNDGDDAATLAQLAEIAENLHRRELTALERNKLLAQWMEIVGQRKEAEPLPREVRAAVLKDGRKRGPQHMPSGIKQVARNLGVPETNLRQASRIAKLSPEAQEAAVEHKLDDNQSALLEAAKAKTPEAQVATLRQRAEAVKEPSPRPRPASRRTGRRWQGSQRSPRTYTEGRLQRWSATSSSCGGRSWWSSGRDRWRNLCQQSFRTVGRLARSTRPRRTAFVRPLASLACPAKASAAP